MGCAKNNKRPPSRKCGLLHYNYKNCKIYFMPEELNDFSDQSRGISTFRRIGNIAIAALAGIAAFEVLADQVEINTLIPLAVGSLVAFLSYRLMRKIS